MGFLERERGGGPWNVEGLEACDLGVARQPRHAFFCTHTLEYDPLAIDLGFYTGAGYDNEAIWYYEEDEWGTLWPSEDVTLTEDLAIFRDTEAYELEPSK